MNASGDRRPFAATVALAIAGAALLVAIGWWWRQSRVPPAATPSGPRAPLPAVSPPQKPAAPAAGLAPKVTPGPASGGLSEEKAARVAKIKRDYDEVRTKASADYSAAGANFPGGLNAFLKQLALLEREMRADLAAILTPRELEDLELRETNAGKLVQRLLADTAATDEQRREVFRLQRAFEDKFALTFDLGAAALLARETARQQLQEQIRPVLGDALFAAWLSGEGGDFGQFQAFAARQQLPGDTALALWRTKNEFTRRRLELNTRPNESPTQRRAALAALVQETETRLLGLVGPTALPAARAEVFGWLPKK